jgi:K+-sensing histidine kinase KdpD
VIDNAGKHNRPHGSVRVRVDVERHDGHGVAILDVVNTTSRRPNEGSTADVRETGSRAGNRIGLTVVEAVLEAHEGTLEWVPSGDEVEVRVSLPLATTTSDERYEGLATDDADSTRASDAIPS